MQIDPVVFVAIMVGMFLVLLTVVMVFAMAVLRRGDVHVSQACESAQSMLMAFSDKYEKALDQQAQAYMHIVVRQDLQIIAVNSRYLHATSLLMGAANVDQKLVKKAMQNADRATESVVRSNQGLQQEPLPRKFHTKNPREEAELAARRGAKRMIDKVGSRSVEASEQSDESPA